MAETVTFSRLARNVHHQAPPAHGHQRFSLVAASRPMAFECPLGAGQEGTAQASMRDATSHLLAILSRHIPPI